MSLFRSYRSLRIWNKIKVRGKNRRKILLESLYRTMRLLSTFSRMRKSQKTKMRQVRTRKNQTTINYSNKKLQKVSSEARKDYSTFLFRKKHLNKTITNPRESPFLHRVHLHLKIWYLIKTNFQSLQMKNLQVQEAKMFKQTESLKWT